MKKFKPKFHDIICMIIPENTDDVFIDVKSLEFYRTSKNIWHREGYEYLALRFGKNVFVFDVKACEFTKEG